MLILVLPNTIPAKHGGVKSCHLSPTNPDGYSLNFRFVDVASFTIVFVNNFYGKVGSRIPAHPLALRHKKGRNLRPFLVRLNLCFKQTLSGL